MATLHLGSKQTNIEQSIDQFFLDTIFNPVGVRLYLQNEDIPVDMNEKPDMWGIVDIISTGAISGFEIESGNAVSQKKELIANVSCFQKMYMSLGVGSDRYGLTKIIDQFSKELGPLGYIPILDFDDLAKPRVAALEIINTPSHQYIDTYEPHGIRMCVVMVNLSYDEEVSY